jgi:dienelactone hydrolase
LVLGYPSDIGDGELAHLAERLARLGYFVIVPRLPNLAEGYLEAADVNALVSVTTWVGTHPAVDEQRIGMAGFCVGSSLALLAAADERIADDVAVVNVFGGYADLAQYIRAIAASSAHYGNVEYPWQPAEDTVALFVRNVMAQVHEPDEFKAIGETLNQTGEGSATRIASPVGRAALALLNATGPKEADAALAIVPAETSAWLREMSPLDRLDNLSASVFVMHDRSDPYVPSIEASRLWDALDDQPNNAYTEFELFSHVRPDHETGGLTLARDAIALTNHLARFFVALDG